MITRAKPPQPHRFRPRPRGACDLLGVAVAPFDGDFGIRVGVDEHVEGVGVLGELREEGDGGGDLAEEGLDFLVGLFVCF